MTFDLIYFTLSMNSIQFHSTTPGGLTLAFLKRLGDIVITLIGAVALVGGIKHYRDSEESVPKPTKQDQVTRIDYLSGHYKEVLEERERQIAKQRKIGTIGMAVGVALVAGGFYLLARTILADNSSSNDQSVDRTASTPKGA